MLVRLNGWVAVDVTAVPDAPVVTDVFARLGPVLVKLKGAVPVDVPVAAVVPVFVDAVPEFNDSVPVMGACLASGDAAKFRVDEVVAGPDVPSV